LVVKLNGSADPVAVASVPQYITPVVSAFTSQLPAVRLRIAKEVVVALVVVEFPAQRWAMVEEAADTNPLLNLQDKLSVPVEEAI
jgi:hypothetical protein